MNFQDFAYRGWECNRCTFSNKPDKDDSGKDVNSSACSMCGYRKASISGISNAVDRPRITKKTGRNREKTPSNSGNNISGTGKRKYRQASQLDDGSVEIICYTCRRNPSSKVQKPVSAFFAPSPSRSSSTPPITSSTDSDRAMTNPTVCSICRSPLKQQNQKRGNDNRNGKISTVSKPVSKCPHIKRLDSYQKIASSAGLPFEISASEACTMMREDCALCGKAPGLDGNGLTRLRVWPERLEYARKKKDGEVREGKQFMGPFCTENLKPACGRCNLMKGARDCQGYVESCRHIATFRTDSIKTLIMNDTNVTSNTELSFVAVATNPTDGDNKNDSTQSVEDTTKPEDVFSFNLYPHRFRNNISKRSRSSYISKSSTHTKTHALTNETFNLITSKPCHYCGKKSNPSGIPPHHNGLDRLDSDERVYSEDTVVSCCGDCNIMKFTHTEKVFLKHVWSVAVFHRSTVYPIEDKQNHTHKQQEGEIEMEK